MQLLSDLPTLAQVVGRIPDSDAIPAAWYVSIDPDVIKGYERWKKDYGAWVDCLDGLMEYSGLKSERIYYSGWGRDYLMGVYVDDLKEPPLWWRKHPKGYLVPRRRTKAEKSSEVSQRFAALERIPSAIEYVQGMPTALYLPLDPHEGTQKVYFPSIFMRGESVQAFLAADPDGSEKDRPFEPDSNLWQRMKMSTYHLLRERQATEPALD